MAQSGGKQDKPGEPQPGLFSHAWIGGSRARRELQERCAEVFLAVFQGLIKREALSTLRPLHPDDKVPRPERDYGLFEAMKPLGPDEALRLKALLPRPQRPKMGVSTTGPFKNIELSKEDILGFEVGLGLLLEGRGGRAPTRLFSVPMQLLLAGGTKEPAADLHCLGKKNLGVPLPLVLGTPEKMPAWSPHGPTIAEVLKVLEGAPHEPRCAVRAIQAIGREVLLWETVGEVHLDFPKDYVERGTENMEAMSTFVDALSEELAELLRGPALYLRAGIRMDLGLAPQRAETEDVDLDALHPPPSPPSPDGDVPGGRKDLSRAAPGRRGKKASR